MRKSRSTLKAVCGALLLLLWGGGVHATAGARDANGCHDSAKIGRHCHPQAGKARGNANHETDAQRDKRLRRECKGLRDAGVCKGYVKTP